MDLKTKTFDLKMSEFHFGVIYYDKFCNKLRQNKDVKTAVKSTLTFRVMYPSIYQPCIKHIINTKPVISLKNLSHVDCAILQN